MTYMMECPFCGLVQAVPRSCDPLVPWEYARNCVNCRAWIVGGQRTDLPEPAEIVYVGRRPLRKGIPGLAWASSQEALRPDYENIDRVERDADGAVLRTTYLGVRE